MSSLREQLLQLLANKGHSPVVEVIGIIFDDQYLEKGMQARVVEIHEGVEGDPQMDEIILDFSDFVRSNRALERPSYYDRAGVPRLTATESGHVPKNNREEIYIMHDQYDKCLKLNDRPLFFEYLRLVESGDIGRSTPMVTYVEWLERGDAAFRKAAEIVREQGKLHRCSALSIESTCAALYAAKLDG